MNDSFSFRGYRIHTEVLGAGPSMVVVHGTPWSSRTLKPMIDLLAHTYRVHVFDMLGYGQSAQPDDDVSLGVQNQLLDQLLEYWGLQAPIAVGHDFGGTTVLRAHLINRQNFSAMVLIDPVVLTPWGSPFFAHVREHCEAFEGLPHDVHRALVAEYVRTAAYRPLDPSTVAEIIEPWMGESGQRAFYRQIAQADETYTDEIVPLLSTTRTPTLVLWGEQDSWIPVERGHRLARAIPGATLQTIAEAGHLVVRERPDVLSRAILGFCGTGAT